MKFRTQIPIKPAGVNVSHSNPILCLGSCFAEHMGGRLEKLKFPVFINPFGIVYNPVSVVEVLDRLLIEKHFTEEDLFENLGLWHSYAHHGHFSHPEKKEALAVINEVFESAISFLANTTRLVLTLGTANVFVLKSEERIVANCHKMPGQLFERRRLSIDEVASPLCAVLEKLKLRLPELEVIATISPVRHLRDGLIENQRSKATLALGLEKVLEQLPFVHYFPSYEILLDDLRDYRFYDKDLSHPNEMAVDYIWEQFGQTYFNSKTRELCEEIKQVITAASHRPFHPNTPSHQVFKKKQLAIVEALQARYPSLDFTKEKSLFT